MRLSRRTVVFGFAGTALAAQAAAKECVLERRVYDAESLLPPREVLECNGIYPRSVRRTASGTEYLFPFDSLESRCAAWDRFNSDPVWCMIRDAGGVRLREIVVLV